MSRLDISALSGVGINTTPVAGVDLSTIKVVASTITVSSATVQSLTVQTSLTASTATIQSLTVGTSNYGTYGSSGTITPNALTGNVFSITLTSTATINGPSNAQDGQTFRFRFIQGAGGSHAPTLNIGAGNFTYGSTVSTPTFSNTAGSVDYVGAIYESSNNIWHVVATALGFSQ